MAEQPPPSGTSEPTELRVPGAAAPAHMPQPNPQPIHVNVHLPGSRFNWIFGIVSTIIFVVVGLTALSSLGFLATAPWSSDGSTAETPVERQTPPPIDWSTVDTEVRAALTAAREAAILEAQRRVNGWRQTMEPGVQEFLDWYFSYWTQQAQGLQRLYYWAQDQITGGSGTADERVMEEIEDKLLALVLRPQIAQLEIDRITQESVRIFTQRLEERLAEIQAVHGIPREDWNRHIGNLAELSNQVEGSRNVPIEVKAVVGGSAVLVTKAVASAVSVMKSGATMTKFVANATGKVLGPLGVIIIVWDVIDHQTTVAQNWPILERNLNEFLDRLAWQIIHGSDNSIEAELARLQARIVAVLGTPQDAEP